VAERNGDPADAVEKLLSPTGDRAIAWLTWLRTAYRRLSRSICSSCSLRFGDVLEYDRELALPGPESHQVEVSANACVEALKPVRLAGENHPSVAFDPIRLRGGQRLKHTLADNGFRREARSWFKRGVDGQIPEIRRLPCRVEDHLAQREAVQHLVERASGSSLPVGGMHPIRRAVPKIDPSWVASAD